MDHDVIIVGAGIAGLTSGAYLAKAGHKVLICEKHDKAGGLINSFEYKGFTFDGGIRAIENSGIILPMLRQLGIDMELLGNDVSLGIGEKTVSLTSKESLADYKQLLKDQFPDNSQEIDQIIAQIHQSMEYLDVLYGIDNPLFLDLKKDREYLLKTILPWMFKYFATIKKITRLNTPIDEYLKRFTSNQSLIDIIAQHFFKKTPAFFALSYLSLYIDYKYPKGGTGTFPGLLETLIRQHGGQVKTGTEICRIDPKDHVITDSNGNRYTYKQLIWAADLKRLYSILDTDVLDNRKTQDKILAKKNALMDKTGGDSILTLYLTLDMNKDYFAKRSGPHYFYTPLSGGLSNASLDDMLTGGAYPKDRKSVFDGIKRYLQFTTYEISCPVMRDATLAPEGKTGLIVSTLMDFSLVKHIEDMDWYDAFKSACKEEILDVLDASIYPGIKNKTIDGFVSTPLTLQRLTGNAEGAITGWAFTNQPVPAVSSLPRVATSVLTPVPDILQAGQWTFSPSGLPISILTGKLAADRAGRALKKKKSVR